MLNHAGSAGMGTAAIFPASGFAPEMEAPAVAHAQGARPMQMQAS